MDNDRCSEVLNPTEVSRGSAMRKLDEWKSRVSSRTSDVKRRVMERSSRVKPMIHDTMKKADRDLHANPAKWAGIAAGASFVLGMIGREMRHRMSRRSRMSELIIIET